MSFLTKFCVFQLISKLSRDEDPKNALPIDLTHPSIDLLIGKLEPLMLKDNISPSVTFWMEDGWQFPPPEINFSPVDGCDYAD